MFGQISVAMQEASYSYCTSRKRIGLLLLWLFIVLTKTNIMAVSSHGEKTNDESSLACNASHPSPAVDFHDQNGVLTKYLFSLVISTKIDFQYFVRDVFANGCIAYFKPNFTDGDNRWDVIVGGGTGFHMTGWQFRCMATNDQVEMVDGARRAYFQKNLSFGWQKRCEVTELPLYVKVFVRNLNVYARAYTNVGLGQKIEEVADMGLAKSLPLHTRNQVYVGEAGKDYIEAMSKPVDESIPISSRNKNAVVRRMIISTKGDEELQNVFPPKVDYRELQRQNLFSQISRFRYYPRRQPQQKRVPMNRQKMSINDGTQDCPMRHVANISGKDSLSRNKMDIRFLLSRSSIG